MEADFSGYVTKTGLKCSDGRTILPNAFMHQDKLRVPLVWAHGHSDPENVLGHVLLENRPDGVYGYAYFNETGKAEHARALVEHRDINSMSIWANQLVEKAKQVMHGMIREVSLVLAGANPGALIENVTIRHSDGSESDLDEEVVIYTGEPLVHGDEDQETSDEETSDEETSDEQTSDEETSDEETSDEETSEEDGGEVQHADGNDTVQDVYESMSDEQKTVLHFMVGEALASASVEHSDTNDETKGSDMKHGNIFDESGTTKARDRHYLDHDALVGVVEEAKSSGSLRKAVENYALAHGIEDIDLLFPDAQAVNTVPEFLKRRTEWVADFLGATTKSPFSRIKSLSADITEEQARAKGYVTGTLKKEEFFGVARRVTTPTTVYKKQKLDRDDMVDITDLDVVAWLKGEMRLMLDEEVARAGLLGDGRDVSSEDKINEGNIRPIASDHELYTTTITVNIVDGSSSMSEVVDHIILNRSKLKGSGTPIFFTTEYYIGRFLTQRDSLGRRLYKSLDELALELRVSKIVAVEPMEEEAYEDIIGVLVNPVDYTYGASKGGEVSMFDDFDIDYNQYKYLIETRCCGTLTRLKSAMVVRKSAGALVVPAAPTFDEEEGEVTITNTTGVVYKNGAGTVINAAGSPYSVAPGETYIVNATPASSSYYFATSDDDSWEFTAPEA